MSFAPYLLDRLGDDPRFDAAERTLSLEQLKASVARDVEDLLNTRRALDDDAVAGLREVRRSVLRFGVDDFSSRSMDSALDRDAICRGIERAIADHEPRLRGVVVAIEPNAEAAAGVRFLIRARLVVHPAAEPVSFDALMQTGTKLYRVEQSGRPAAAPPPAPGAGS